MATLFVDKLDPQSGTALEIGTSGDTVTIPAGATFNVAGTVGTGFTPGITHADQWRLSANQSVTTSASVLSGWERPDDQESGLDCFGRIGTGMSESSGTFTFPSTGYWDIRATFQFSSGATDNQKTGYIATTTDNSSYSDASHCVANFYASGTLASANTNFLFDCTNTSTHKVRFRVATTGGSGNTLGSDTDKNMTFFTFIRLANT